mmetsp:Transcript_38833/g.93247  ORF Transcript_38833/g.93247 Transcript_38833/m.93247 type:complete len:205 (-) Transcript_38833:852-1466(-)
MVTPRILGSISCSASTRCRSQRCPLWPKSLLCLTGGSSESPGRRCRTGRLSCRPPRTGPGRMTRRRSLWDGRRSPCLSPRRRPGSTGGFSFRRCLHPWPSETFVHQSDSSSSSSTSPSCAQPRRGTCPTCRGWTLGTSEFLTSILPRTSTPTTPSMRATSSSRRCTRPCEVVLSGTPPCCSSPTMSTAAGSITSHPRQGPAPMV